MFKWVTETIKYETKEQKGGFLETLVGTLGSILLRNLLSGKGSVRTGSGNKKGKGIVRAVYGERIVRAGYGKEWDLWCFLIL